MANVSASRTAKEGPVAMTVAVEAAADVLPISVVQRRPQMEQSVHVRQVVRHRQEVAPTQRTLRARALSRPMFAFNYRGGHVGPGWALDVLRAAYQDTHPIDASEFSSHRAHPRSVKV